MREAGVVAIACLAAITLTACGGAENGTARAKPDGSGSPTAAARPALTAAGVRATIRAAADAAGLGQPHFSDLTNSRVAGPCSVVAKIDSRVKTEPVRETVKAFVAVFRDRGWHASDEMPDPLGVSLAVDKDGWSLSVLAGALSKKQVAAMNPALLADQVKEFRAVSIAGFRKDCTAPTPTP